MRRRKKPRDFSAYCCRRAVGLPILIVAGCFFGLRRMAGREFGGMSGDLAGYIITLSQLLMLLGYVFAERMAEVWF